MILLETKLQTKADYEKADNALVAEGCQQMILSYPNER